MFFFKACFCPFREWVPLTCPAGLHFDTSISTCNWPAAANCGTCAHFLPRLSAVVRLFSSCPGCQLWYVCSVLAPAVSCGTFVQILPLAVSCGTYVHILPWLSAVVVCSLLALVVSCGTCAHFLLWSVSCGTLCSLLALVVSCGTCVHFLP